MKQLKWQSKTAWGVLIGQAVIVAGLFLNKDQVTAIDICLGAVLTIASAFGVFNNPESKGTF